MVELVARGDGQTVDGMLEGPRGVTVLGDLLSEYRPADVPVDSSEDEHLATVLDRVQRQLGALEYRASARAVTDDPTGDYVVELRGDGYLDLPDEVTGVRCWQVSAGQGHQVEPRLDARGLCARLGQVSYDGLTSFFAIELTATAGNRQDHVRFVVNAHLQGAPPDRVRDVLARMLKDKQDLLRYLLFLLSDAGPQAVAQLAEIGSGAWQWNASSTSVFGDAPLLETLLEALVGDPDKVDHVARLLADLRESGRDHDLVPTELAAIWQPIAVVRDALRDADDERSAARVLVDAIGPNADVAGAAQDDGDGGVDG